jgi:hypothetical protein
MLAAVYVATASAQIAGLFWLQTAAGPQAYASCTGQAKDVPRPIVTQRRHIPMVKPVVLSPVIPNLVPAANQKEEWHFWHPDTSLRIDPPFAVFSNGNRAPPLA